MAEKTTTMAETTAPKKIILRSSDNEDFEVDAIVASESQTLKHMIEDGCADTPIPLTNIDGYILFKVIEYCEKHVESAAALAAAGPSSAADKYKWKPWTAPGSSSADNNEIEIDELAAWDAEFVKGFQVDQDILFDILLAAHYLDIKGLLDLMCQTVADMMKGKTPEEVRKTFHIKNDYTPEEEEEIRRENQWAFEKFE